MENICVECKETIKEPKFWVNGTKLCYKCYEKWDDKYNKFIRLNIDDIERLNKKKDKGQKIIKEEFLPNFENKNRKKDLTDWFT